MTPLAETEGDGMGFPPPLHEAAPHGHNNKLAQSDGQESRYKSISHSRNQTKQRSRYAKVGITWATP
jgi:hypothetical protein